MKNQLIKILILNTMTLFVFSIVFTKSNAQSVKVDAKQKPFFYLSAAYVASNNNNHVTGDPFFSKNRYFEPNRTVRADVGIQFNNRISVEAGYMRMPLEIGHSLDINDRGISNGNASYTRISFYSIRLKHGIHLLKNKLLLKTGLGYALGKSGLTFEQLGPSTPVTDISFGHEIVTSRVLRRLHTGNSNFLAFDIGLEINASKNFAFFINYSMYNGFNDLMEETIEYRINGLDGTFRSTADGSFKGYELGLKFNFR